MRLGIGADSVAQAEMLRRALADAPGHEIAWVAHALADAVAQCAHDRPELMVLDLEADGEGGVAAVQTIMRASPCPILITSSSVDQQPGPVFQALGAGAVDVVRVPRAGQEPDDLWIGSLLARIDLLRRLGPQRGPAGTTPRPPQSTRSESLVVIGASAGGPAALATVLSALPVDFPAPLVVVQHIEPQFALEMVEWLNAQCQLDVRAARSGDRVQPGAVYIAAHAGHLVLRDRYVLAYQVKPRDTPFHPSIDVFFHSVAAHWPAQAIGVLLTGMGQDGAAGLRAIRDTGALTIAQDRSTSAVYGIPKAAARMRAAVEVLPLPQIAKRLQTAVRTQ